MSKPIIYYWSSNSGGTRRVAESLKTTTQPIHEVETVDRPFIALFPTYDQPRGGFIPVPVERFLDAHQHNLVGVIASGNRNFSHNYCAGGIEASKKYGVPVLYRIEIMGTTEDYDVIDNGIKQHWNTLVSMRLS